MNARRRVLSLAALCAWLAAPQPAAAHRLDEYLQATLLSVEREGVGVEIHLTPGVATAGSVFSWIDANHDGSISEAEGRAYAGEVLRSAELSVDGRRLSVTLLDMTYPTLDDMKLGVGTIRLRARATGSTVGPGHHHVSFRNSHRPETSVYLVNALVPADPRIQIMAQRRDTAQRGVTIDYDVTGSRAREWFGSVFASVIAVILVLSMLPGRVADAAPDRRG